jgi:transposase
VNGKESKLSGKHRVYSQEFKADVAQRIVNGESVSALHHELQIKRSVLYRWRDAYRKQGAPGLAPKGRPPGLAASSRPKASPEEAATQRIAELERKIGQQALDLDFLRRAFKRVKESRPKSSTTGATASMERSEQ